MEYSKLVAVTGLPGLFELINNTTGGAIVRSLEDKTTRFVSSRIHSLSHLESIEIFTTRDNVNLVDLFHAMEKSGARLPDEKDPVAVKKYFEKVFPEMDFERVYASDMKKISKWFAIIKKNNVEIKLSEPIPEEPPENAVEETQPVADEPDNEKKPKTQAGKEGKKTIAKKKTRK